MPQSLQDKGHIVIVADDGTQTVWLRSLLVQGGYQVEVCSALNAFRDVCKKQIMPVAVIMDRVFAGVDDAGMRTISAMKKDCLTEVPVILLSARDDMTTKLAAYRAGITRYLTKPVDSDTLLQVLNETVPLRSAEPFRVLMVDDDPYQLAVHASLLREAGMEVRETPDPLQVPSMLDGFAAEVLLLDMYMPQCSGPELAVILRDDDRYASIPIIYLSSEIDTAMQLLAMDRAEDHFLTKPVEADHLVTAVSMLAKRYRHEEQQAELLRSALYIYEHQQMVLDQHAIVSVGDVAGNIIYANDKFCEISGYNREELLDKNHRIIKSDFHPPEFYAAMWHTISNGRVWQGEVCNKGKDGRPYWVKTTVTPIMDANGQPYQYISMHTDIIRVATALALVSESEQSLNRAQQVALLGSFEWNVLTRELKWSEQLYRLWDMEPGSVMPSFELFSQNIDSDDLSVLNEAIKHVWDNRTSLNNIFRLNRADGSKQVMHGRGEFTFDESGKAVKFVGTVQDITLRRQGEEARYEALERLQKISRLVPGLVYQFRMRPDGSTSFPYVSEGMHNLFGIDSEDLRLDATKAFAAVHPDDLDGLMASLKTSAQNLTMLRHEFRTRDDNGRERWKFGESLPQREEDGSVLWHGFITDISERKRVEFALTEREHFQKMLIDIIPGMVGYWTHDLHCKFASSGYEEWFGRTSEQLHDTTIQGLLGEDLYRQEPYIRAVLRGEAQHFERSLTRTDGTTGYVWAHYIPDIENGRVRGFFAMVSDITEIKMTQVHLEELNKALNAARVDAELANLAKSEFVASMSHELRTPLNAILGFSQLFGMDKQLPKEVRDNAQEIERAGQHLLLLVNDLIDLARIEAGKLEFSMEPVSLKEVVRDSLTMVSSLAADHHIEVKIFDFISDDIMVQADYLRLRQVLINLLTNGIKYNRPQGSIRLSCQVNAESVRISVTDTGLGIPVDKQSRVFNEFDRLGKERGQVEGTGIGLVITKRIVEAMDGSVGFESTEGQGSTFWVMFPVASAIDDYAHETAVSASAQDSESKPQTGKAEILYIEDNPMNMRLMQQILARKESLELREANSGEIGLESAFSAPPALILLDINLPGMNGYQTLARLKADARTAHIPVVAVSANAMVGDKERGLKAGFSDYLVKPLDVGRLLQVVEKYTSAKNS